MPFLFRVLKYFEFNTSKKLVDPSDGQCWIKKKADKLGLLLRPKQTTSLSPLPCPELLKMEINNPKNAIGWCKSIDGIPKLTIKSIEDYHEKANKCIVTNAVKIKKPFARGNTFFVEKYVDESSMYAKHTTEHFCIKGICAASLKKVDRWIFVAINKKTQEIDFVFCQCPAVKGWYMLTCICTDENFGHLGFESIKCYSRTSSMYI